MKEKKRSRNRRGNFEGERRHKGVSSRCVLGTGVLSVEVCHHLCLIERLVTCASGDVLIWCVWALMVIFSPQVCIRPGVSVQVCQLKRESLVLRVR